MLKKFSQIRIDKNNKCANLRNSCDFSSTLSEKSLMINLFKESDKLSIEEKMNRIGRLTKLKFPFEHVSKLIVTIVISSPLSRSDELTLKQILQIILDKYILFHF